jgi:methenyltetrahydromethanopterin cyclohydrolase
MSDLNQRAEKLAGDVVRDAAELRVAPLRIGGAQTIDCGIDVHGGLEAGRRLAEICLAGAGDVQIVPGAIGDGASDAAGGPLVVVRSDRPVAACMAAQYAGWQVSRDGYFAMGSGPMRAAAAKEELFQHIGCVERPEAAVGVLETAKLPTPEVCRYVAEECRVAVERLTLLVAPTSSLAGTVQVVARSVETALHKLHELRFDLHRVISGFGSAPLPPVAADDLAGIGRTNDAVLYGGEVTLWVTGDDRSLQEIGPLVPSGASPDHGKPFAEIFERYGRDFYRIDPRLFSPAVVTLVNVDTGRSLRYGSVAPEVLRRSFGG